MDRRHLLDLLNSYSTSFEEESGYVSRFISLINNFPGCFSRELVSGHLTGSAWVVTPDKTSVVLLHHQKLGRWLQPGGHADGDENILRVAEKELEEETGLKQYRWLNKNIFDLDIHVIPARKDVPSHFHFDVRFIAEADPSSPLRSNGESTEVGWIPLSEVAKKTANERSIERMVEKTKLIS